MSDQSYDRFTLPGDIPDASYWRDGDELADAQRRRDAARAEDAAENAVRGYSASHPAGRGWIPQSRDIGLPREQPKFFPTYLHEGEEHEFPHGTPQDLVAALGCGQVFTLERRVRFLDHLAFQGNARAAARSVRVSHETAYRARRQDPAFAALWDAAMVHARAYGEQVLATRALDGVEVAIVRGGEIVGYQVRHDPRLLLAHLGRLDRRVEEDRAAQARAEQFDALLAAYAGHPVPEGFAEAVHDTHDWRNGAPLPDLPPTREAYVNWCRGEAMGGKNENAEARAMAAAGEAAGELWDEWHAANLAAVGRIVETPVDGAGQEGEGEEAADHSRLPHAGNRRCSGGTAAGGGPATQPDPPIEVKSAPPATLSHPSTPPCNPLENCDNSMLAEPGTRCHVRGVRGGVGGNDPCFS